MEAAFVIGGAILGASTGALRSYSQRRRDAVEEAMRVYLQGDEVPGVHGWVVQGAVSLPPSGSPLQQHAAPAASVIPSPLFSRHYAGGVTNVVLDWRIQQEIVVGVDRTVTISKPGTRQVVARRRRARPEEEHGHMAANRSPTYSPAPGLHDGAGGRRAFVADPPDAWQRGAQAGYATAPGSARGQNVNPVNQDEEEVTETSGNVEQRVERESIQTQWQALLDRRWQVPAFVVGAATLSVGPRTTLLWPAHTDTLPFADAERAMHASGSHLPTPVDGTPVLKYSATELCIATGDVAAAVLPHAPNSEPALQDTHAHTHLLSSDAHPYAGIDDSQPAKVALPHPTGPPRAIVVGTPAKVRSWVEDRCFEARGGSTETLMASITGLVVGAAAGVGCALLWKRYVHASDRRDAPR